MEILAWIMYFLVCLLILEIIYVPIDAYFYHKYFEKYWGESWSSSFFSDMIMLYHELKNKN